MKTCTFGLCKCHLKLLAIALLSLFFVARGSSQSLRSLLQDSEWVDGRATWYDTPEFGSCGYGRLDTVYKFGPDAVGAFPDAMMGYAGSCGRCFEIKCRGTQITSGDGSVNTDRSTACIDENKSIIIKIVDTCPCKGNERWCCGDQRHFDLGQKAFEKLAPLGVGVIGLSLRAVPCSAANGTASGEDQRKLERDLALGASPDIFVDGDIGIGWAKVIYGDTLMARSTYNSSLFELEDGSVALCTELELFGGFSFNVIKPVSTFTVSKGVEFWARTEDNSVPDMNFKIEDQMKGPCTNSLTLEDGKTEDTQSGGWVRYYFPISSFQCTGDVKVNDLDRVRWESRREGTQICVKDVRLVPQDQATAATT